MNATRVHSLLHDACQALDAADEHAIAAYVGLAMTLLADKYGIGVEDADHSTCK